MRRSQWWKELGEEHSGRGKSILGDRRGFWEESVLGEGNDWEKNILGEGNDWEKSILGEGRAFWEKNILGEGTTVQML